MLLQKREENAITLASTANNGRIIKAALPSKKPVSPKKMVVMLTALVLGMGIPVGFIYLKDLLKYKIENAEDVEKITDVPILGELPLSKKPEKGAIVVQENQNGMMEELFVVCVPICCSCLVPVRKWCFLHPHSRVKVSLLLLEIRQSVWPIWVRKLLLWVWISASRG